MGRHREEGVLLACPLRSRPRTLAHTPHEAEAVGPLKDRASHLELLSLSQLMQNGRHAAEHGVPNLQLCRVKRGRRWATGS